MIINVKVVPKASRNCVKEEAGRLKVYLTAAPEKNKANKALIVVLSSYFKVSKSSLRIVKGEHSAQKTIALDK
jgi:hypothetical protein